MCFKYSRSKAVGIFFSYQKTKLFAFPQNIAHTKCDMSLRDAQTMHFSDMISITLFARDSVILLVSATKMVRIYLFTSSLFRYRGKKAKKCFRLSRTAMFVQEPSRYCSDRLYSFGKHC